MKQYPPVGLKLSPMSGLAEQKYITAFEGILTPAELHKAALEMEEFSKDIPPLQRMPLAVRNTAGRIPDRIKQDVVARHARKADRQGRDYSDVVGHVFNPDTHRLYEGQSDSEGKQTYHAKLNYRSFMLSDDGQRLCRISSGKDISTLFPKDKKNTWPTLVLLGNSNLVSPQSFFDSFQFAKQIIPAVTEVKPQMVLAGVYFSQKHFDANALDTMRRYRTLGMHSASLDNLTPGAEMQGYQLLDILLERDAQGAVLSEGHKPVLRADAVNILKHVICYGYSGAHMTNKDAFRMLRSILISGDVKVQYQRDGEWMTRDSSYIDAKRLIPSARIIGIAGMDRMELGQESDMPQEVDFISPRDYFANALLGPVFLKTPNVIQLTMKDDSGHAIEDTIGGHAQDSYLKAILSHINAFHRQQARTKLNNSPVRM
jgi:hypothetical protein